MKKKYISIFTFLICVNLLILTASKSNLLPGGVTALGAFSDYSMDTNMTLKLEFIGFDEELVNETEIDDNLYYQYLQGGPTVGESSINFTLEFNYASQTEYNNLVSYVESIGVNGTGVGFDLNRTQLELDLASGERNDILIPQDGLLIDAELTEEYIFDNLYEEDPEKPGYTMYFLNFSVFDADDHSLEHWYKVESLDFDTNDTQSSWFSSFNDIPYVTSLGWGGDYRFCFLDLSARTWYYDWIDVAWGAYFGLGSQIYHDYRDLDELSQLVDITSVSGNGILSEYISDYIQTYIINVFGGYYYDVPIVESYSLQVKVFNNLTNVGYTLEDVNWVISELRTYNQLAADLPWIDWDIQVDYVNIQDYPDLYNYIANNIEYDVNGPYLEIIDGFFFELADQLGEHFDLDAAESVLPCYFFLNDDVGFKYNGVPFAGLGGMGWEILVADQYKLFRSPDPSDRGSGMTATLIHELGHSLGYPHPHSPYYGWGSSFIKEVMNYFSRGEPGFSTFYVDALARAHANYFHCKSSQLFDFAYDDFSDEGALDYLVPIINDISYLLVQAAANYTSMDYFDCIASSKAALEKIDLFYVLLDDPDATNTPTETSISTSIMLIAMTVVSTLLAIKRKRK